MEPQEKKILSIAPMIDVSNTHFRFFTRLLTKKATLYTEMLHHDAIIHNHSFLLPFNVEQHPVILQVGGCDPSRLAQAAAIGERYGYDGINLNVGCPSPRVQKGSFGACLMKQPELVEACMRAMAEKVKIACTVKCRLGVDQFDSYEFASDFVKIVSKEQTGLIKHFVIHARKAFLKGLNPAQNRNIPPLMYDRVYQLKKDFPLLTFQINGGIKTIQHGYELTVNHNIDGCMIGRAAYENPYQLRFVDEIFYGMAPYLSRYGDDGDTHAHADYAFRNQIMMKYAEYVQKLQKKQITDKDGNVIKLPNESVLVKPVLNLFNGERNCSKFRNFLSDHARLKTQPLDQVLREAAAFMLKAHLYSIKMHQPQEAAEQIEIVAEMQQIQIGVATSQVQVENETQKE